MAIASQCRCIQAMKSPLAIVTMVYNEPDYLPVWAAHYRRAVGAEHCYVIDHGSDDGSLHASGPLQAAKLPRSPVDEIWRADIVSRLCNALLDRYQAVAYTDVDELLVADPRRYSGLVELSTAMPVDVLTAFGANVLHVAGEAPLDLARPITEQRGWTRPYSTLCKPLLVRRPVRWSAGFHEADAPTRFDGLYLCHIAYADNDITARRQAKRQTVERPDGRGAHHGTAPDIMVRLMQACAALPRDHSAQLGGPAEAQFVEELRQRGRPAHGGWVIAAEQESPMLWAMPAWLKGSF